MLILPMTDPCMLYIYMVTYGSHQYTPFILAYIYQHHGSVMGYVPLISWLHPVAGARFEGLAESGASRALKKIKGLLMVDFGWGERSELD